jgi:hypothetical protein
LRAGGCEVTRIAGDSHAVEDQLRNRMPPSGADRPDGPCA